MNIENTRVDISSQLPITSKHCLPAKYQQFSVKCPQFYKDSASADIIQYYASSSSQKVSIICQTRQQSQILYNSQYLHTFSVLIHNGFDRRERIKNAKQFQQNPQVKCLITNNIGNSHVRKFKVKCIIFISPLQIQSNYQQIISLADQQQLKYIFVMYSTKEIQSLCHLQVMLNKKFQMLQPPNVQSQSESSFQSQNQETMENNDNVKFSKQGEKNIEEIQYKVVVKNLDNECKQEDLKKFLQDNFVQILDIKINLENKNLKQHKRNKIGFVTCKNKNSYEIVLKLNGISFQNKHIIIVPHILCQSMPILF